MAWSALSPRRRALLAAVLSILIGLVLFVRVSTAFGQGQGFVEGLISRALSTPGSTVSVGEIEGLLSSDMTIRNIEIADKDGLWLTIDRTRVVWKRLALLGAKLEIETLDVDRVEVARRPVTDAPDAATAEPFRLPQLPVAVVIDRFSLDELVTAAPVLGQPAQFSATGSAHLEAARGLGLVLDVTRQDRPGTLAAKLDFVPETEALQVDLRLDEPAGGVLAELVALPDRPPILFELAGRGTLDAFRATLDFDAGPRIGADGTLVLDRDGKARKLALDLGARISDLLPAVAAPIFADGTKLEGTIAFADDGSIAVPGVALVAAAARVDISGDLTADRRADLVISGANRANTDKGTVLRDAEIERFALDARLKGALDAPSVDASLIVEKLRLPTLALGRLSAKLTALPREPTGSGVLDLRAEARASDLGLAETAVAEAIGSEFRFDFEGSGPIFGPFDVAVLRLATPTLSADFEGRAGTDLLKGRLAAKAPNLSRFGRLAKLDLGGEAELAADVEAAPQTRRITAKIDALARRFSTGIAQVDGLAGGEVRLAGAASYDPVEGFTADDLTLTGLHANARLGGAARPQAVDVTAALTIPALEKADKRLSGRGEAKAQVTGTFERPNATFEAAIRDGAMLGRPVPRLVLEATAADLLGAVTAEARLDGTIGGKPATGRVELARLTSGELRLDPFDLGVGSVVATGAGTIDPAHGLAGRLSIRAPDLDDLSPLVLEKLAGRIDADVTFDRSGPRQDLAIKAEGRKISGFGMGLDKVSADLTATDVTAHPVLSGFIEALQARVAGETIERIRLEAKAAAEGSDVTLTAAARDIGVEARGRVIPAEPVRIDLSKLDARRGRTRVGLAAPTTITILDGGVVLDKFALAMNGGRLAVDGRVGPQSDLKITARAVPLSVADLVQPDLGLGGSLDGEAAIAGALAAPTGTYRFRLQNVVTAQTKSAGLPPIGAEAEGRLDKTRTDLDAAVTAGAAGRITVAGTAPIAPGAQLDLAVKGALDLGVIGRGMATAGRRVAGAVTIDGRVTGTLDRPQASGSAVLANGSYRDAASGTRFESIRGRLVARDDKITIDSATAIARNGGTVKLSGEFRLDPANGFPGTVTIAGQRAEIIRSTVATAIVDLDLAITGPLARFPRLTGRVGIETLDIAIPDRLPGELRPLEGTRHIAPTPTAKLRLALAAEQRRAAGETPFDAALDLTVDVPGRIRVTGRGLDAELGGSLKILGTLADPQPDGAFNLVRGRLQILSTQLDFTRANLTFSGNLSPQLDFLATTQAGGASIRVAVTGHPSDPQFTFTSSPDYPQDEILSRLLFGQGSGRLTPTQALALTQAVAIYTGGTSALENLRRSLGLGDTSKSRNPLTNWLGDRVSLGIRTGATPAQTGVGIDISVWKQLKARGAIDARGAASVGVGAEYEW